ncbi:MAG: putative lipid II flippase FtsW [Alphaproteobacteria bacterium]|nr:putative lipid II flippase FtsW [Alphaproteobacteria bacterium]
MTSIAFTQTDRSLIGRWWRTIDRWTLAALILLIAVGGVLALAATPAVAERLGYDTFHFAKRQMVFLPVALAVMFGISLFSPTGVRRFALVLFAVFFVLTIATLFMGHEVKGASRWIKLGSFTLQPSEFLKSTFVVVAAWMFANQHYREEFPGFLIATGLYAAVVGVLLLQPDFGMTIVVSVVWGIQFFLAGLPMLWVVGVAALFLGGGVGAYFVLGHVQSRIDRFLDPASGDTYQVSRSMEAFLNGGWFGTGPGEGTVKSFLPDAHADFIFAVAGEEFGLFACLFIVLLFAFIVLRGFLRMFKEADLFALIATVGLLVQFGLQAIINMASTLHLIPTKGMTLPFISYGGSSALALAIGMGMVLALTRERKRGGAHD